MLQWLHSVCSVITVNNSIANYVDGTGDLLKFGLVRPKQCYFFDLVNVVTFQLLQKCPY